MPADRIMHPAWRPAYICLLHPISVRTGLVRAECYYIWYWIANTPQHMVIF
jgi:hypothetical protein